jgi:hypothetical protein
MRAAGNVILILLAIGCALQGAWAGVIAFAAVRVALWFYGRLRGGFSV